MTEVQTSMLPDVPDTPLAHLPGGRLDALAQLRSAITRMDDRRAELAEQGDWESLSWALGGLRALIRDLRTVETATVADVAGLLPERRVTVDGLGTVERRRATTRRAWDTDRLVRHLVTSALVDTATGELRHSSPVEAAAAVVEVLTACAPFTPSMGWRAGALRDRGITPGDWCDETHGPDTVTIHGADQ